MLLPGSDLHGPRSFRTILHSRHLILESFYEKNIAGATSDSVHDPKKSLSDVGVEFQSVLGVTRQGRLTRLHPSSSPCIHTKLLNYRSSIRPPRVAIRHAAPHEKPSRGKLLQSSLVPAPSPRRTGDLHQQLLLVQRPRREATVFISHRDRDIAASPNDIRGNPHQLAGAVIGARPRTPDTMQADLDIHGLAWGFDDWIMKWRTMRRGRWFGMLISCIRRF